MNPARRSLHTIVAVGIVVLALVMVASACGGSSKAKDESHPLTSDQAAVLADALYLNYQDKGATFTVNAAYTSIGRTITMQGEIDWANGVGHARVRASGADTGLSEVWWNSTTVVEYWPAIARLLPGLGYEGASLVSRAADPDRRLVDHAIAAITALAVPERENPVLIQQKEGSQFVRTDDLRGVTVDVLRYGTRSSFWIATDTDRMIRFDGNAASGSAPMVIDLLTTGEQRIDLPPSSAIVSTNQISSVYESLTS